MDQFSAGSTRASKMRPLAAFFLAISLFATLLPAVVVTALPQRRASSSSLLGNVPTTRGHVYATSSSRGTNSIDHHHDEMPLVLLLPPNPSFQLLQLRGGATTTSVSGMNSDLPMAWKACRSTIVETVGLVLILWGADQLAQCSHTPHILRQTTVRGGLPVVQWIALFTVIFGSSAVIQSLLNVVLGSGVVVSVARSQTLQPGTIPGNAENWYVSLKKPWFNPPGWLFPIMWLIVSKPTQLWGVSRILRKLATVRNDPAKTRNIWWALTAYCGHLALGDTWNQVFFGGQRIRLGAFVICTFWSLLAVTGVWFGRIDRAAGQLMLPTLGWVTVATALNLEIYRLNK